jgi:hypothetical protein
MYAIECKEINKSFSEGSFWKKQKKNNQSGRSG